ncbi:MAG: GNAT family N-acetyltransferase [Bacilli bacterium]|nr:GNAT family N-acetyltransferase [Bacilli bacterium]
MSNITYRKSIKQDIPAINDLFIEMIKIVNKRMIREGIEPYLDYEKGYEEGYLDSFYINDDKVIYVALDDDEVIGFISIINNKELGYIYIDDYCVKDNYRGQGIGSKLINISFDFAKDKGYDQIFTHVEKANKESIDFYWHKGFKMVQEQDNRLLIRKVSNHLSKEKQNHLFSYNNNIINKIMEKIKFEYPDSVDMIAVAGSFCSQLFHEKSDLDLLIIANNNIDSLSICFILDGIGQDIHYKYWKELEHMSDYNNMFVTKLKDLNIVYYRNNDVLEKYKQLQDKLNKNMDNDIRNNKTINKYLTSIIEKKNSIKAINNLNDCYKIVGSIMNDIENILFINNKQYLFGGTKNILTEITFMPNKPEDFIEEYKKILDLTNIKDIKKWVNNIVKIVLTYFNKEDNNIDTYNNSDNNLKKIDITKEDLIGTYEELYSNYYNKLLYASKINNKYLSFRTMIDAQIFFDEFTSKFNIPDFNLIEKYNPKDLKSNINEYKKLLSEWKKLYDKFQIDIEEYKSIEDLYSDNIARKLL